MSRPFTGLLNPAEPAIDLNESPLFDAIHFSQFTLEPDPETTEAAQTSDPESRPAAPSDDTTSPNRASPPPSARDRSTARW
jgi:hypothetical protein